MQCSAVQCSAVQCSAVQCNAVQCCAVQCSAVQCSAVQCGAVQYSALHYSAVQEITVQYSSVQCHISAAAVSWVLELTNNDSLRYMTGLKTGFLLFVSSTSLFWIKSGLIMVKPHLLQFKPWTKTFNVFHEQLRLFQMICQKLAISDHWNQLHCILDLCGFSLDILCMYLVCTLKLLYLYLYN